MMKIGASIFFTEYSISPAELAVALEERGFDSLWVAEHSHIPVTRRFSLPDGMELKKIDAPISLSVSPQMPRSWGFLGRFASGRADRPLDPWFDFRHHQFHRAHRRLVRG